MLGKDLGELVKLFSVSMGDTQIETESRYCNLVLEEVKKDSQLRESLKDSASRLGAILQKCQNKLVSEKRLEECGWGKIYRRRIIENFGEDIIDCLVENEIKPIWSKVKGEDIYGLLDMVNSGEAKLEDLPLFYQGLCEINDNGSEDYKGRVEKAKAQGFMRGFKQLAELLTNEEIQAFVDHDVKPSEKYRSRTLIKDVRAIKERDGNIKSFLAKYQKTKQGAGENPNKNPDCKEQYISRLGEVLGLEKRTATNFWNSLSLESLDELMERNLSPNDGWKVREIRDKAKDVESDELTWREFESEYNSVRYLESNVSNKSSLNPRKVSGSISPTKARKLLMSELDYQKKPAREIEILGVRQAQFLLKNEISPTRDLTSEQIIELLKKNDRDTLLRLHKEAKSDENNWSRNPFYRESVDKLIVCGWNDELIEKVADSNPRWLQSIAQRADQIAEDKIPHEEVVKMVQNYGKNWTGHYNGLRKKYSGAGEGNGQNSGSSKKELKFDELMGKRGKYYLNIGFISEGGLESVRHAKAGRISDEVLVGEIDSAYRLAFAINDYLSRNSNSKGSEGIPIPNKVLKYLRGEIHNRMSKYGIEGKFLKTMAGKKFDEKNQMINLKFMDGVCGLVDESLYSPGEILELSK